MVMTIYCHILATGCSKITPVSLVQTIQGEHKVRPYDMGAFPVCHHHYRRGDRVAF